MQRSKEEIGIEIQLKRKENKKKIRRLRTRVYKCSKNNETNKRYTKNR